MSLQKTGPSVEDLEAAMTVVHKISAKVDLLFEPLKREMKIMKWPVEYQAIMWEAVMLEAKARWEKCQGENAEC